MVKYVDLYLTGKIISHHRMQRIMSIEDMVDYLEEVSVEEYNEIEIGKKEPSLAIIFRLMNLFDLKFFELVAKK